MNLNLSEDVLKSTYRLMLAHVKDEYQLQCARRRDIERKAQGNIAISGVFIAGTLLVLKTSESPPMFLLITLGLTIFFLAFTAVYSLLALNVETVYVIQESDFVINTADKILVSTSDAEAKVALREFVNERLHVYKGNNQGLERANNNKEYSLEQGQNLLMASIYTFTISIFIMMLCR